VGDLAQKQELFIGFWCGLSDTPVSVLYLKQKKQVNVETSLPAMTSGSQNLHILAV